MGILDFFKKSESAPEPPKTGSGDAIIDVVLSCNVDIHNAKATQILSELAMFKAGIGADESTAIAQKRYLDVLRKEGSGR